MMLRWISDEPAEMVPPKVRKYCSEPVPRSPGCGAAYPATSSARSPNSSAAASMRRCWASLVNTFIRACSGALPPLTSLAKPAVAEAARRTGVGVGPHDLIGGDRLLLRRQPVERRRRLGRAGGRSASSRPHARRRATPCPARGRASRWPWPSRCSARRRGSSAGTTTSVKKHLVEVGCSGSDDLGQRPHGDAGRVHVDAARC